MLREKENLVRRFMMIFDSFVICVAFFALYYFVMHLHSFYKLDFITSTEVIQKPVSLKSYSMTLLIWIPLWLATLHTNGMYRSLRTRSVISIIWIVLKSGFFSAIAFASLAFMLKIVFVSRVFFVMFVVLSTTMLILEKKIIMFISHASRRRGYNYKRLLVVGTGLRAKKLINTISRNPEWGLKVVGLIDEDPNRTGEMFFGYKVMGTLKDIPGILTGRTVDEVMFVVPRTWLNRIQKSIAFCEQLGVKASVAADLFELEIAHAKQEKLGDLPLMIFETTYGREWQLLVKRIIDIVFSFAAIIVFAPLMLVIAGLVKITSPGPAFFRQRRVSLHGRIFTLYKFRSMFEDASKKLEEVKHLNEMDGPVFKIKNDPRVTPLGSFLRKLSLDELPQFFNVFLGYMSLVGPRPPLPNEVKEYEPWQRRRLSMRSGLTCLWQIGGRNEIDFDKWMKLDLKYIDNWTLWLDFEIIAKTIPAVLWKKGAR